MNLVTIPLELQKFKTLLAKIMQTQECHHEMLKQILDKVMCNELTVKQTDQKFSAIACSFYQVRDGCKALMEKLDESCGTITEMSWAD